MSFQVLFRWLMTPKMILSALAEFWKELMGLVLRRTSLKALSMAFVVRTFFQWSLGQSRNGSSSSRSSSMHLTAFGAMVRQRPAH